MEFLHCNRCGYYPNRNMINGQERRRFYLTSCGHVVCNSCTLSQPDSPNCLICKAGCRTAEICATAKPEINAFFMDPMEKVKESMQTAVWMVNFQRSQMKSFTHHLSKFDAVRHQLEHENKLLKEEVSRLKQQKVEFKQGVSPRWIKQGEGSQVAPSFLGSSGFMPMFPQSAPAAKSEIRHMNGDESRTPSATGLRLTQCHVGPGRLTLPFTPVRSEPHRHFSPGFSSIGRLSSISGSNVSAYGTPGTGTPDITARLRQLQCQPGGPSPNESGHFSQKRQYY